MELISEEDQLTIEEEKKWTKTLLISVATIFFILVLLFSLWGYSEDSLDAFFLVPVFISSLIIAVIAGGLLTYYNHFRATVEATVDKIEHENAWEFGKMAFIRILLGVLIIYWRVNGSEGFLRGDGFYVIANNIWNLYFWVIAFGLILAGMQSLYYLMRALISDEDEDG